MTGRRQLVGRRQFGPLGQGGIEDLGIGLGQQEPGRIAGGVALDFPARRIGRIAVVAAGPKGGPVHQGAIVEMQDEDRRVRRDGVDLVQGRQAFFGELVLGEAADDADPLRRRSDRDLGPQHVHGVGHRRDPVPAQLQKIVQPAPDQVGVTVVQPRDQSLALQVDQLGIGRFQPHRLGVAADVGEDAVADDDRRRPRIGRVQRCQLAIVEDQVGRHRRS